MNEPTQEELAAIAVAFQRLAEQAARRPSAWTVAMRNPGLAYDELRELVRRVR